MELISTFMLLVSFIIAILFIIWGIYIKYKNFSLVNKCTNRCDGILIKTNEIKIYHISDGGWWCFTKSYVPIYEYKVQKNKYKIKGTNGTGFKIGNTIKINYNPQKPEECYVEGSSFVMWKILVIIGSIILVMSIGFIFLIKLTY